MPFTISVSLAVPNEDIALDTPFKALFSLADWTNIAVRVLSEIRAGGNSADIQEASQQLIETYPVRAQSCLQYMQQFLSIQEQHLMQQKQMITILHQQQQTFYSSLESLNPVRSNTPRNGTPSTRGNFALGQSMFPTSAPLGSSSSSSRGAPGAGVASGVGGLQNTPMGQASSSSRSNPGGGGGSRKRVLESDVVDVSRTPMNIGPLYTGDVANGIPSETMINIIIAKRVALTENTDDFGLPAYTTNTPNGVSLVSDCFSLLCCEVCANFALSPAVNS